MQRAALTLALLGAACASAPSAPISYGSDQTPLRPPRAEVSVARPSRAMATAATEEGFTALSEYALRPEEAQPYDPARLPATHRVGVNESLYDIATLYQVPLLALIDQNNLQPPYVLAPGTELRLPPPRFYIVASGEGLDDVAVRNNVDPRSLALLNRMQPPYVLHPGDRIVLPGVARSSPVAPAPSAPVPQAGGAASHVGALAWPLRGEIVARFGAQLNGARLDGIEIAGREGEPIKAAADGVVVYAGADLPAYGTLVLVRHADNYVTAYGFARRALVREGAAVHAGEAIAELGGRPSGRARLLFQVRQGSAAVDPTPLLGR